METAEQPNDLVKQTHNEDFYELILYVVGNNRASQLAFENLKEICYKYLLGMCHIEVIDLSKNPGLARAEQILAIPTLVRKSYPRRIVGDLSNIEKVLEFLDFRSSSILGDDKGKGNVENTSTGKAKVGVVKSKKSNDLQPYIGSDLLRLLSKNQENECFIYSISHINGS